MGKETLGQHLENITELQDIIWEYLGPIDDFDDSQEFQDIVEYAHHLKCRFVEQQKYFNFEEYLIVRAFDIFDYRKVTALPLWKINSKHSKLNIKLLVRVIGIVAGQIAVYMVRLLGKITI